MSDGLEARFAVERRSGFTLDVELMIEPGTTAAVLGPNGAGKSTTVSAIAGLLPVDRGRIAVAGRTLDEPAAGRFVAPEHRRLGIVFQDYLLFDHLSVLDNIAFGPASTGSRRRAARQRAQRWIDQLDLGDLADRRPSELSGGQAQRVALARALATEPDLLLLDEPLAALDIAARTRLRRALSEHLATYPGPRLLITHDPADAFVLADRIHVLEGGRLTQSGTADDIRCRPATPYVAALAGTNLLAGTSDKGTITLDDHAIAIQTADRRISGPVLATIHPSAIALHRQQPHGSPRNSWSTTIATVETFGDTVRISLGDPLPLTVDVTPEASSALELSAGQPIWAAVKATEVTVSAA